MAVFERILPSPPSVSMRAWLFAGFDEKTTTPTVYTACAALDWPIGPSSGPPRIPIVGAQLTAAAIRSLRSLRPSSMPPST